MLPSHILLVVVLGAVMTSRVVELAIAERRLRNRETQREPVFPWMVAVHTSLFVLVPLEVFGLRRAFSYPVFAIAAVMLTAGTALRFWVLRSLGENWNVRIIPPTGVVATGPYRFLRHPNYLAVIIEIPSVCMIHGAWISALFLSAANATVLYFRIRQEETVLASVPGYLAEMGERPRFIPRFRG